MMPRYIEPMMMCMMRNERESSSSHCGTEVPARVHTQSLSVRRREESRYDLTDPATASHLRERVTLADPAREVSNWSFRRA